MKQAFSLELLVRATGGKVLSKNAEAFSAVGTDGRADNKGKIFFALKGDNFDAHEFLGQAVKSGASALVVHRSPENFDLAKSGVTVIEVGDTLRALQNFATHWRDELKAKVIGITGSNGKTTTKEFAAAIISEKYQVQYSKGSFNNHVGVPLTLLSARPEHDVIICEMGMNHPGELTELSKIAKPDVVVVTTVGRGHLEGLGTIEGIAVAKEEIYLNAPQWAVGVFNLDNTWTKAMWTRAPKGTKIITFSSQDPEATVRMKESVMTLEYVEVTGEIAGEPGRAKVPVFGRQNVNNLMAAAAIAYAVGVEPDLIWRGMTKCSTTWGRNQILSLQSGARMIFDGYNANPDSMAALLDNFSRLRISGRKFAVLGEMLELGSHSEGLHFELGSVAGAGDFDFIWFIGPDKDSFESGARSARFSKKLVMSSTYEERIASEIGSMLQPGDIVLVKGSRGMKLERVVKALSPVNFEGY